MKKDKNIMSAPFVSDPALEKECQEQESRIQLQLDFASGLFQGDVTVRTLLESLAEGVVIIDNSGTILLVNTSAGKMFDYPKQELIGKPLSVLIPERFRKVHEEHVAHYFEAAWAGPVGKHLDLAGRRRDGCEFPLEISLNFIETINGVLVLNLISDVTERKQMEDELKKISMQNELILASAGEGIVGLDLQGNLTFVNASAAAMLGYEANELVGRHGHSMLHYARPDGSLYPAEQCPIYAAYKDGVIHSGEEMYWRKDGSGFSVEFTSRPMFSDEGIVGAVLTFNDITERKRMDEVLRKSEKQFAKVQRLAHVGSFVWDIATDTVTWSDELFNIFGVQPGENGVSYAFFLDRVVPEDRAETERVIGKACEELLPFDYYHRIIRPDGKIRILHCLGRVEADDDGKPAVLIGASQDVTELKEMEEALKNSEELLRLAIESTDIGTFDFHPSTGELIWSERTKRHFGLPPDARVDFSIFLAGLHPADRERVERISENILRPESGGEYINEYRTIGIQDGKERWIAARGRVYYDEKGQAVRLTGTTLDITDRKRTDDALRLAKSFTDTVINSMPGIFYVCDDQGLMVRWNKRLEAFSGRSPEEMAAMNSHDFVAEEDQGLVASTQREVLIERHNADVELLLLDSHGKKIPHYCTGSPMTVDDRTYLVGLGIDISEFKRAQEEIARLNADLAVRATELENANLELEAFNYTVAHDLRQPLNAVSGYCQLIKELCGDKLDERCRHYLQKTYTGTLRMSRLIDTLLNFSRLAHIELRRETINIGDMAKQVTTELKLSDPERRVTFRIADGVSAEGDPYLLEIVLDNLIGNAWKYTGTREEAVIEFGVTEIDGKQAYFVRDNGPGFNMADADKLFIPFKRLPGTEECRGFGIGLATVERIIRRHGGRIWAAGEPDKGATFFFTL